ncbi:MAG: pilus assembly protein [Chloroflexi bacterium]|nr:MAG: pilus assembly protein [Chloroflexota bacterium]TME14819.1 MAG: pilus assembly protein [Chloroflexota bacterium]TME16612.1 MAG: pilus assembly protein [Chloroflexota bacterium]
MAKTSSTRKLHLRGPACNGEAGQALVEFAVSVVFLTILLAGLLDITRAFHYTVGLQGAVRAGARHGAYYSSTQGRTPYLDDADIKAAVDQVLSGDGLPPSTFRASTTCLAPIDGNSWVNPRYGSSAYPPAANTPWLYICYDTQGSQKTGTLATPPGAGTASPYTSTDLVVILLDRYGLIGGLSTEYLKSGSSLTSIQLTAFQHFSVQG